MMKMMREPVGDHKLEYFFEIPKKNRISLEISRNILLICKQSKVNERSDIDLVWHKFR